MRGEGRAPTPQPPAGGLASPRGSSEFGNHPTTNKPMGYPFHSAPISVAPGYPTKHLQVLNPIYCVAIHGPRRKYQIGGGVSKTCLATLSISTAFGCFARVACFATAIPAKCRNC